MKNEKKFDAVKMMREIRDKLSEKLCHMSYEEQKRFIAKSLKTKPEKHNLKKDTQIVSTS